MFLIFILLLKGVVTLTHLKIRRMKLFSVLREFKINVDIDGALKI